MRRSSFCSLRRVNASTQVRVCLILLLMVRGGRESRWKEVASQMAVLWDSLTTAFGVLGFDEAAGDEVFGDLVLARIVEPTSKRAAVERVLPEIGVPHASYRTVKRRLRLYAAEGFRDGLAAACARAARLGPASLLMFDVTNLWFETDKEDEFRVPGFSKERRVDPLIQIGLLADASGMPLMITAWEGNTAETKTMIPTLKAFLAAHRLHDVVIVAEAGMISAANSEGDRGRGVLLHPRGEDGAPALRREEVACRSSRGRVRRRAGVGRP